MGLAGFACRYNHAMLPTQGADGLAGRDDAMIEIGQRQAEQLIRRFLLFQRKAGMRAGSWAAVQHLQLLHQLPLNHQIHRLVQGGLPLRRTGQAQQHKQADAKQFFIRVSTSL